MLVKKKRNIYVDLKAGLRSHSETCCMALGDIWKDKDMQGYSGQDS